MCLLIETIKIKNNRIYNIGYHNSRMNITRKELFGYKNFIDLSGFIEIPENNNDTIKCRIIYNKEIIKIEYNVYQKKNIKSLKVINSDDIDYKHKYKDRNKIEELLKAKNNCDDILIIKNDRITDTSFTNIAFYNGVKWLTPAYPLLKGTKRQKLLDENKIMEADIFLNELNKFQRAILFNSMLDLEDEMYIEIDNIKF